MNEQLKINIIPPGRRVILKSQDIPETVGFIGRALQSNVHPLLIRYDLVYLAKGKKGNNIIKVMEHNAPILKLEETLLQKIVATNGTLVRADSFDCLLDLPTIEFLCWANAYAKHLAAYSGVDYTIVWPKNPNSPLNRIMDIPRFYCEHPKTCVETLAYDTGMRMNVILLIRDLELKIIRNIDRNLNIGMKSLYLTALRHLYASISSLSAADKKKFMTKKSISDLIKQQELENVPFGF